METEPDTDTEMETDTEKEKEKEPNMETDTETETETDMEAEKETNTDTDTKTKTDTETETDTERDTAPHRSVKTHPPHFQSPLTTVIMEKLTINGIEYVPASSKIMEIGECRIIVADRGWVWVGNCTDEQNGDVTIRNAKNIQRWGTTKGLGELVNGPTNNTKYHNYGTVRCKPIITIAVNGGWPI